MNNFKNFFIALSLLMIVKDTHVNAMQFYGRNVEVPQHELKFDSFMFDYPSIYAPYADVFEKAYNSFKELSDHDNTAMALQELLMKNRNTSIRMIPFYSQYGILIYNKLMQSFLGCFEQEIVSQIKQSITDKEAELIYLTVGKNHLLRDAIILTKLLDKGFKNIVVNLVNTHENLSYFLILNDMSSGNNPNILLNRSDLYNTAEGELTQFVRLMEFIRCNHYKDANLRYFVYNQLGDYVKVCGTENAHVLVDIDYEYDPAETFTLPSANLLKRGGGVAGVIRDYTNPASSVNLGSWESNNKCFWKGIIEERAEYNKNVSEKISDTSCVFVRLK